MSIFKHYQKMRLIRRNTTVWVRDIPLLSLKKSFLPKVDAYVNFYMFSLSKFTLLSIRPVDQPRYGNTLKQLWWLTKERWALNTFFSFFHPVQTYQPYSAHLVNTFWEFESRNGCSLSFSWIRWFSSTHFSMICGVGHSKQVKRKP